MPALKRVVRKRRQETARHVAVAARLREVLDAAAAAGFLLVRFVANERLAAREQSASIRARERRLGRPLTRRERAAEMRRFSARHRRAILEARRRAEAARRAAIARQCAIDKAMRDEVQSFIAKDDLIGEDPEVRRVAVNALGNHAGTVVVMDPIDGPCLFHRQSGMGAASWFQTLLDDQNRYRRCRTFRERNPGRRNSRRWIQN